MTGKLTTKHYNYATVFVDQYSWLSYVYLQKRATAEETLEGKWAFKAYVNISRVKVKGYHTDNGVFCANKWVENCIKQGQSLTFAGVNAHHENGICEQRIQLLQDLTCTQLIHANCHWDQAITANLWPYAMRMANDILNNTPSFQDDKQQTPQQIFSSTDVNINPKHWQPFGCPTAVLATPLATSGIFHKWKPRSRVGIYLGHSPQHSQNVALILDIQTGLVSPQFHVKHDPSFHAVKQEDLK